MAGADVAPAVLAEGIEVRGAWMDNGLLHIDIARPQPEVRVKTIQITKAGNGTAVVNAKPERAEQN